MASKKELAQALENRINAVLSFYNAKYTAWVNVPRDARPADPTWVHLDSLLNLMPVIKPARADEAQEMRRQLMGLFSEACAHGAPVPLQENYMNTVAVNLFGAMQSRFRGQDDRVADCLEQCEQAMVLVDTLPPSQGGMAPEA